MAEHLQPDVLTGTTTGAHGHRQRVEALVGAWLAGYRSSGIRRAYRQDLKTWLAFCMNLDLDPLTAHRSHVEVFARSAETAGLASATVARRLTALSSWYAWLVDEDYMPANPLARVRRPHVPEESRRAWLGRLELADMPQTHYRRNAPFARVAGRR